MPAAPNHPSRRAAFTLTELMIAIAVLVGVLLAVSKIFSTTTAVTRAGRASADVLQDAAAIERQLRSDLASLAPEGFFAIRCVAVPNDVHGAALLNPDLPPTAEIRADQLVFLTNGVESAQTFRIGSSSSHQAQGTLARVYFGHGFQVGDAGRPVEFRPDARSFDPVEALVPWTAGTIQMQRTRCEGTPGGSDVFRPVGPTSEASVAPLDPRRWLLVRQPVLLVNDDTQAIDSNGKTVYLDEVLTARSIFLNDPRPQLGYTPQILHGRVDAAATQLGEMRRVIRYHGGESAPWRSGGVGGGLDQYRLIADELLYYPRAERAAPSMHRVDQALTNAVLGTACSSVRIEWTWEEGTGVAGKPGGAVWRGVGIDSTREQPWFGLRDDQHGVLPYGAPAADRWWRLADTIDPDNVETERMAGDVRVYEAVFGFNRDEALNAAGAPDAALGYTPWPSALRVTLILHDARTTLEAGREVQFVIDLPR